MAGLTPLEYSKKYTEMRTFFFEPEGEAAKVEPGDGFYKAVSGLLITPVRRYRLGTSDWYEKIWWSIRDNAEKAAGMPNPEIRIKITDVWGMLDTAPMLLKEIAGHFHWAFVGKGSPEQCQLALQMLYRFHKAKFSVLQFMNLDFMGLDCNGFAGNYLQRVVYKRENTTWRQYQNIQKKEAVDPNASMGKLMEAAEPISDLAAMDTKDVHILIEAKPDGRLAEHETDATTNKVSYGHVILTEPNTLNPIQGGIQIDVVELTADVLNTSTDKSVKNGLRYLPYTIKARKTTKSGQTFTCERGAGGKTIDVRIGRLKST